MLRTGRVLRAVRPEPRGLGHAVTPLKEKTMTNTTTPQQIAALNDRFCRQGPHGGIAGRMFATAGISALPMAAQLLIWAMSALSRISPTTTTRTANTISARSPFYRMTAAVSVRS